MKKLLLLLCLPFLAACIDKGCIYGVHIGSNGTEREVPEGYSSWCEGGISTSPMIREAYTPKGQIP